KARDGADVLTLDVEEQRTADRIFAGSNGFQRRGDTVNSGNLQRVAVLVVEGEAEDTDSVGIGGQAGQGLGVVTGDFDDNVLTEGGFDGFDFFVGEAFGKPSSFGAR